MKRIVTFLFMAMIISSCSDKRTKAEGEIVLSEFVYEENGIYYKHAVNHRKVKYSGKCEFFWHSNGKKKGVVFIENGLPVGHWQYWNEDGSKKLDLYFESGKLVEKEK